MHDLRLQGHDFRAGPQCTGCILFRDLWSQVHLRWIVRRARNRIDIMLVYLWLDLHLLWLVPSWLLSLRRKWWIWRKLNLLKWCLWCDHLDLGFWWDLIVSKISITLRCEVYCFIGFDWFTLDHWVIMNYARILFLPWVELLSRRFKRLVLLGFVSLPGGFVLVHVWAKVWKVKVLVFN